MKKLLLVGAVITALVVPAGADIYTFSSGFANGGNVPDFPLSGWSDTRLVAGPSGLISDVNVMLDVSGGWNGDLYGYLRYVPTGSSTVYFAQLLNRVGQGTGVNPSTQYTYGFGTAGFSTVWLDDAATANGNIHGVQNPVLDTHYVPDGGLLSAFNGLNANGNWTLFLQDKSAGDQSKVENWGLEIMTSAVPEPGVWPVALLLAFLGGVKLTQYLRPRKLA